MFMTGTTMAQPASQSTRPVRMFEALDCPPTPQMAFASVLIPPNVASRVLRSRHEQRSLGCAGSIRQVVTLPSGNAICARLDLVFEANRPYGQPASEVALGVYMSRMKRDAAGALTGTYGDVAGNPLRSAHGRWQAGREELSGYLAQAVLRDSSRNRFYSASIIWSGNPDSCGSAQLAKVRSAARLMARTFAVILTDDTTDPASDVLDG
jgi:hypothetical protein